MVDAITALSQGTRLVYQKGLRRYIFLPILVNLIVYASMLSLVLNRFDSWLDSAMTMVPSWLEWLSWLIWPLFFVSLLVVIFFTFTLVTHLIAAPFYGFLAAKVERQATGREPLDDRGLAKTAIDALGRELVKLGGDPVYREGVVTDNGNIILDVHNLMIGFAPEVEAQINNIVGVGTNGLFAARPADILLLGTKDGVQTHKR